MRTVVQWSLRAALVSIGLIVGTSGAAGKETVVVGSTNFPEQLILANIYADVLDARGVNVETRMNLGSREIVFPALEAGEIDVLPEYTGALLGYLNKGEGRAENQKAVIEALQQALPESIVMLEPADAQDKDALVVTPETAEEYGLQSVSDLAPVAGELIVGGPPETRTRYVGLPGLKEVYGVEFKGFRSLDAGGPLTVGALAGGDIDVARMFTTQGVIDARSWVVLADDKDLVPAQNLVPVVRREKATEPVRAALNAVSAKLTSEGLQKLNRQVGVDRRSPGDVAAEWVEQHGLADGG